MRVEDTSGNVVEYDCITKDNGFEYSETVTETVEVESAVTKE
jgi:hypothetical protein